VARRRNGFGFGYNPYTIQYKIKAIKYAGWGAFGALVWAWNHFGWSLPT
jgi:hypothetical protein